MLRTKGLSMGKTAFPFLYRVGQTYYPLSPTSASIFMEPYEYKEEITTHRYFHLVLYSTGTWFSFAKKTRTHHCKKLHPSELSPLAPFSEPSKVSPFPNHGTWYASSGFLYMARASKERFEWIQCRTPMQQLCLSTVHLFPIHKVDKTTVNHKKDCSLLVAITLLVSVGVNIWKNGLTKYFTSTRSITKSPELNSFLTSELVRFRMWICWCYIVAPPFLVLLKKEGFDSLLTAVANCLMYRYHITISALIIIKE